MAEFGLRRSLTLGSKKRKPKDPKDIAQVGGHDRFAEEQALHGVDIPDPRSSSPDDELEMEHNHLEAPHHEEEHLKSQTLISRSITKKRASKTNARSTGAHKVLSHEDAASHYKQSMRSFEAEACPFNEVEAHAAKHEQEEKGDVQVHGSQEHKEGNKTQNARCTGAHKVQDKNEACKHYQGTMDKFQSEACQFHEVESHAAKCEQEKKGPGHVDVKQEHPQGKTLNARCTGAHKVENKTHAAEHYKSSCNKFEKAGYSFHNVESHAKSLNESSENHTEHGNTKEAQHGQINSHNAESHANSVHHSVETHAAHGVQAEHAQNKRCSGAHKVENKQEACEHYKSTCHEFEKAGYSFNNVEHHASSLKAGEHSQSHEAEEHSQSHQAETHHTESARNVHAEGQNKRCSGAHKVENKSAACEHYRNSCDEFEKSGRKFHDVESHAERLKKEGHIKIEQHGDSALKSHGSESHSEQARERSRSRVEEHSNTGHEYNVSSSQRGKKTNARCSGAHKVVNQQEAAAHYKQSCNEFEKAGFSFSNVKSHASSLSRHGENEQHGQRSDNEQQFEHEQHSEHDQQSKFGNKTAESHARQESLHQHAEGENKHNSGAHRVENREDAATHYNSTMESFRSEATEFHNVKQYASAHIKGHDASESSHRDEDRSSAMKSEESHFHTEGHERDEFQPRSRSAMREEDSSEQRKTGGGHNARSSGAYKVRDSKEAANYLREEHRKSEVAGFNFDREESRGREELRMSMHEERRNSEESQSHFDREESRSREDRRMSTHEEHREESRSRFDGEDHGKDERRMSMSEEHHESHDFKNSVESREETRGSRNSRSSGAYKVQNKSMAAEHYHKYVRAFRETHDLDHMENYLDLAALAREGQEAINRSEDDLSRHRSHGFADEERKELKRSSSWEEKSLRAREEDRGRSLSQIPDHRQGLADEFHDEKNSELKRLTNRTPEEERRDEEKRHRERREGTRSTGVYHVHDKDAARAHYLAYVTSFEREGYSWDRIEEFVKDLVDKVENFVDGKRSGVGLRVEDVDLGTKFEILSTSREHSQERGRSGRDEGRDRRGASQGWAEIERRGSHERRSSFEDKFRDEKRRSSRSSSEGRRSRRDSRERSRHDSRERSRHDSRERGFSRERRDEHHPFEHLKDDVRGAERSGEHLEHDLRDAERREEHHILGSHPFEHLERDVRGAENRREHLEHEFKDGARREEHHILGSHPFDHLKHDVHDAERGEEHLKHEFEDGVRREEHHILRAHPFEHLEHDIKGAEHRGEREAEHMKGRLEHEEHHILGSHPFDHLERDFKGAEREAEHIKAKMEHEEHHLLGSHPLQHLEHEIKDAERHIPGYREAEHLKNKFEHELKDAERHIPGIKEAEHLKNKLEHEAKDFERHIPGFGEAEHLKNKLEHEVRDAERHMHIPGAREAEHLKNNLEHGAKDVERRGVRDAEHLKNRVEHDLGRELHHDERDRRPSHDRRQSNDGGLGRRLSTNVLPHLFAKARSRSPNPAARGPESRDHERREHESEHDRHEADRRRDEHGANHHEGGGLLEGLGLGDHHGSSNGDRQHEKRRQEDERRHEQDRKHADDHKHEEERQMHEERSRPDERDHHGMDHMQDHRDRGVSDQHHLSHPGEGHNEGHHGLLPADHHNQDHHGLLSADRTGHPTPKELFHRRQASIKSPGGRKFAGNRPAGLHLPHTVGSDRKDSPPRSSKPIHQPNSRHTGAHKVGDKQAAAIYMKDAYERAGKHVPFDRLEQHAAGLGKGHDGERRNSAGRRSSPSRKNSAGRRPSPNRNGLESRDGDSRRPTAGGEHERREQDRRDEGRASQTGRNREDERARPGQTRRGSQRSPDREREDRVSQHSQAQRRESDLGRMNSRRGQPQRQNSKPQSFRPSDAAARYDKSGEGNGEARRHFEDSHQYSPEDESYKDREEDGEYGDAQKQGDEEQYGDERGEYNNEDAEYDEQGENGEYTHEAHNEEKSYAKEGSQSQSQSQSQPRRPTPRSAPNQPSSAQFKEALRHTGMSDPALESLNYFAGTSSVAPPEVFRMLHGLQAHVADVDWDAEKGWTKEHTSAAIYLGITGLLVFAKTYLGPGGLPGSEPQVQRQTQSQNQNQGTSQKGFMAGFGAGSGRGSGSGSGSAKGPMRSSMARPIKGIPKKQAPKGM